MAERVTRKMAENAFCRAMKAIGADYNPENPYTYSSDGPKWDPIPGRFALDYNSVNGGLCIVKCTPPYREGEGCGETHVTRRMGFRDFCESVRFMTEILWHKDGNTD